MGAVWRSWLWRVQGMLPAELGDCMGEGMGMGVGTGIRVGMGMGMTPVPSERPPQTAASSGVCHSLQPGDDPGRGDPDEARREPGAAPRATVPRWSLGCSNWVCEAGAGSSWGPSWGCALLPRVLHAPQEQTSALAQPQPEPGGRAPAGISDAAHFHAGQSGAPSPHRATS